MSSKRLDLKIRILLFLFCTIGILYISMKLLYRPSCEGFQIYDNCVYDRIMLPGRGMWKCPTEFDAMVLLTDTNIPKLNDNDAICYKTPNSSDSTKDFYTCYQRPAGTTLSLTEGVLVPNNSLYDTMPGTIKADMEQVCADYNGELAKFVNILKSTVTYQGLISSATENLGGTITTLSKISTSYCPNSVNNTINSRYTFCQTLNTGIGIFINLSNGPISVVSTQITGILLQMEDLYKNQYIPAYAGFQC